MSAPRDPEELGTTAEPARAAIADDATVGAVHLTVADLQRSLDYYRTQIGLQVLEQGGGEASLGTAGRELLRLVEQAGARPAGGYTGLYHFALLVPQRVHLAAWLAHAARDRVGMTGMSDHFVSEALYLRDPDDNGVELYWDRLPEQWPRTPGGELAMFTQRLDLNNLLKEVEGETPAPKVDAGPQDL
jgi:catechol 2,3-dioxygenase